MLAFAMALGSSGAGTMGSPQWMNLPAILRTVGSSSPATNRAVVAGWGSGASGWTNVTRGPGK